MFYFDKAEKSFQSVAARIRDVPEHSRLGQAQIQQIKLNLPKKEERVKERLAKVVGYCDRSLFGEEYNR